jgi:Zn-dependent protease
MPLISLPSSETAPDGRAEPSRKSSRWIAGSILLAKMTKLAKIAKLASVAFSLLSALCFAGVITPVMGMATAGGITLLLLIHEMGHAVGLHRLGFGLRLPVFIPFLGAAIAAPAGMTRRQEASMAYAGPLWGTAACVGILLPGFIWPSPIWISISMLGVLLNAFNMTPVAPLDGGRILRGTHDRLKYLGLAVLVCLTFFLHDPTIILIWIIVLTEMNFLPIRTRFLLTLLCTGLLVGCLVMGHSQERYYRFHVVTDIALAVAVCLGYSYRLNGEEPPVEHLRPYGPAGERMAWMSLWMLLLAAQVALFLAEAHLQAVWKMGTHTG